MSWREAYRSGSWRGVTFRTADVTSEGGRRGELHEFPQRDLPYREDLGRAGRRFTLECWVAGPEYAAARDALIDACEGEGPGTLVHPFRGELIVACESYSVRESAVSGGIAEFSIVFVETSGKPASAISSPDSAAQARQAASGVREEAPAHFAETFSTARLPGFIEDAAVRLVEDVALLARIAAAPMGGLGATLRAFDAGLRLLPESARALVRQPLALGQTIVGLVSALSALAPDPRRRAAAARMMMGYGETLNPVTGATPPRRQQARNQAAMINLVRCSAAAELCAALSDTIFVSYQEAASTRDDAAERIDRVATSAADMLDDQNWRALVRLRTALVADLTQRGASLARVYSFPVRLTEPALVIARRLYDSSGELIDRAADLMARNRIAHPGFVPGGRALSVLQERSA